MDFVANIVRKLKHDYLIILTGGFTNPGRFPNISEAGMMADELLRRSIPADKIILEERSLTTSQNIEFSRDIINGLLEQSLRVFVVCDSIRSFKVNVICFKWLKGYRYSILGFNFQRNLAEILRQIPAAIKDIVALFIKPIEDFFIKMRRKKWGICD
ncbi:MAG: YdcF family protein [Patescibacteria group bacterium]|nr:YdcF family protein [Patescibacteria group bacterium]